jgi:hypothetical protein
MRRRFVEIAPIPCRYWENTNHKHRHKETTSITNNLSTKRDIYLIDLLADYIEELLYL